MSINLGGMQSLSLMSGQIDYSQIILQLDQINRAPGDALNQTIQTLQKKSDDWSHVSSLAQQVQNDLVTLASVKTFQAYTTSVSGVDSEYLTATASSNAVPGTYTISWTPGQVAKLTSGNGFQIGNSASGTDAVTAQKFSQPVTMGTLTATVGGTTYTHTVTASDTIQSIMNALLGTTSGSDPNSGSNAITGVSWSLSGNKITVTAPSGLNVVFGSAGDSSNFLQVVGLAGQSTTQSNPVVSGIVGHVQLNTYLGSSNFGQALTPTTAGQLSINGVTISYNTSTDTLQSVISRINSSKAGVTAAYNPLTDTVTLTSNTSQPITVQDLTGNLGQALGLTSNASVAPNAQAGQPWTYTVNGAQQTSPSPTVQNAIPGVSFTLQDPSEGGSSSSPPYSATITVSQDTTALTKAVNAFVTDFNTLYNTLQQLTGKGGDLEADPAMSSLALQYMNAVLDPVPGASQYAQQSVFGIGITNGSIGSTPGSTNSLQVDSTALTTAFQNDPNEVQALIQGMAARLNGLLTNLTGQVNTLNPKGSLSSTYTGIAQSEKNMYSAEIQSVQRQQQQIYDMATSQEQMMVQEFTQLQQYQAQMAAQQRALQALFSSLG
ncbi:flagellar filament capping protein FliD [Alicyclobacillus macrosporangiidus]|uniref:flagellar filament capping protein FliD n=1 Tax=Alicyclobacillus macrosporangiidus TaxID=392015 RepID=UPI0004960B81|nr:flagellar filament capping protein FliD [Alicyclobacillus macrosporangiidus]